MDEHREEPTRARATTGERVPSEDFKLRMFMVADYATVAPDGKLYISGAGILSVRVPNPQEPLPTLYLAIGIGVPYTMTSEPHHLTVRWLDADGKPILPLPHPDPLFSVTGETGRPPGTRPGDEVPLHAAIGLRNILAPQSSRTFLHLTVDDKELARLPLRFTFPTTPTP